MPTAFTALQAKTYVPSVGPGFVSSLSVLWGDIQIAANPTAGDTYEMCWTPDRFLLLGGHLCSDDIDTGTATLDMDIGWAANSAGSVNYTDKYGNTWTNSGSSLSATGIADVGVWDGNAITDLVPAGKVYVPIVLPKPLFFNTRTKIQLTDNVSANAFTAGHMTLTLWGVINP